MLPNLFRRARSWLRAGAVLVAVSLAASTIAPAHLSAAPSDYQPKVNTYTPPVSEAIDILQQYGVVIGDENGNLNLYSNISRAEMVTILVRLLGKEQQAAAYGSASFSDTNGHWARGYIAVAQREGLANGYPDGTFRPDNPVTYAEAEALLLRAVGKAPSGGTWPDSVVNQAVSLGIQPPNVSLSAVANSPASRLHVFQSLFLAGTRITLPSTGKTAFQTYLDTTGPDLNVTPLPTTTTSGSVTISGTSKDAVVVYVDSTQVNISGGSFQRTVPLVPGFNSFVVEAFDAVGNKSTQTVATTYATGASRIEVNGPTNVQAGSDVQYTVQVFDKNGVSMGNRDVSVQVVGNIGSYDVNTHTLHVGSTTTTGKLIFTAGSATKEITIKVQGLASGAESLQFGNISANSVLNMNQNYQVRVEVVDKDGTVMTGDSGREITLTASGDPDVTITPTTATTVNGKATFTIRSDEDGTVTLKASAAGLDDAEMKVTFATANRILLRADPDWLPPDGKSEAVITAVLVDRTGYPVKNDDEDIEIELSASGRGDLDDDTVVIEEGNSKSDDDEGIVVADDRKGKVTITGKVVDGPKYTVVPVTIPVEEPEAAEDMQLKITGPSKAEVGDTVTYTVEVRDKNGYLVTSGSYAFQIAIETSNDDYDDDKVPTSMEVTLGDTSLNPVDDGYDEDSSRDGDDVIARTVGGKATIQVTYDVSGEVTITPVPKGYTSEAYDDDGDEGAAASTTEIDEDNITSVTTSFYDDNPSYVKLEVDSDLGKSQPGGAVRSGRSSTVTVRALVVDDNGNWIPGVDDYTVYLDYDYIGSGSDSTIKKKVHIDDTSIKVKDGKAEFKVKFDSDAPAGTYEFSAVARKGWRLIGSLHLYENRVAPVDVEKSAPSLQNDNVIIAVRGYRDGKLQQLNVVGNDDEGMAIALNPLALNNERAAKVRVYEEGARSEIYTSDVVDLDPNADEPVIIYVPREKLDDGEQYEVRIENSRGLSERSDPSDEISVVSGYSKASITGAEFTGNMSGSYYILKVTTSRTSCSGEIDPDKLWIAYGTSKGFNPARVEFGEDVSSSCRAFNILLSEDQATALLKQAGNSPVLEADDGWYSEKGGKTADADSVRITGLVYINQVRVDWAANKLIFEGTGLKKTDLNKFNAYQLVKIGNVPLIDDYVVTSKISLTDSQWVIPLETDSSGEAVLKTAWALGNTTASIAKGWYGDRPAITNISLYSPATVTGVEYKSGTLTIKGSGFDPKSTVNLNAMYVKSWNGNRTAVGGSVTNRTETRITIKVSDNAAKVIENNNYVYFYGASGWLQDSVGITAAPTDELLIAD